MTLTEYKVIFEITDDLYSTQASDNPDALWQAELYIGPLLKGDNGKSAYELAVQHGYVGTEEEWLASLSADVTAENIEEALGYVPADPSDFPIMRGTGEHSIVQEGGYAVQASGENTVAFGELTFASGRDSFASGYRTKARQRAHRFTEIRNGNQLVLNSALGFYVNELVSIINKTKYYNCSRITAIDGNVITLDSLPFGSMVEDESFDHHTVFDALNTDIGSIEIGYYATATGWNTVAAGLASHAEGRDTRSYGQYSHVEGRQTSAGYAAHAEGQNSHAPGERSHAEGHQTISSGNNAHAEGTTTTASGNNSHAEGNTTTAQGLNAHSEGSATVAMGDSSHAEGQGSTASGIISHAEGFSTAASGLYAHAEGQQTSASGGASHAEGAANTSSGLYSHVEGSNNQAIGNSSHAEGDHTAAGGPGSHSEGYESTATGYYSHAEGQNTHAEGDNSHAEGWKSVAEAHNSHAEGGGTHTYSEYSHAEGEGTKTRNRCEHAQGKYNKSNMEIPMFGFAGNTLHSIGIGDEVQDKNAIEVMQNGDAYILGLGQYDGTNPSQSQTLQQVVNSKGTYSKPSGGIPDTDLASGVQTSLGKANTAYQKPSGGIPASDLASGVIKNPVIYVGTCSTASATAAKEATVETFPLDNNNKPLVGTVVAIKYAESNSAANTTLNVNSTGAASIWYNTSVYTATSALAGFADRYTFYVWDGTYWVWMSWGIDQNDAYGINIRTANCTRPVTDKTGRYRLLFSSADDSKWVPANSATTTNATAARTVNQTPINPFGSIVDYHTTAIVNAGDDPVHTQLWQQNTITLGYSFNTTGSAWAMTEDDPVYLKCAPQADGSAIIDSTTPIVFALPTTEDGKIYIYLGIVASATTITLTLNHPVYYYKNGAIRQWTNADVYTLIATTQPSGGMLPNTMYNLGTLSNNTTFTLATPTDATIVNHYYWTFDTGSTAPTITWPSGITWYGGSAPTINANKHYEISVLNNIGVAMEV